MDWVKEVSKVNNVAQKWVFHEGKQRGSLVGYKGPAPGDVILGPFTNPQTASRVKTLDSNLDETMLWIPTDTQALSIRSSEGLTLAGINCKKSVHQTSHVCGNLSFKSFGLNQLEVWTAFCILKGTSPQILDILFCISPQNT